MSRVVVVSSFSKAVYVSVIALEIGMSILLTDCNLQPVRLYHSYSFLTVRSRRQSGKSRHTSGNGDSSCSSGSSYLPHHYNTWLPINPPMPMAGGPVHECSVSIPDESLRSYDPTDIHLGGFLAREFGGNGMKMVAHDARLTQPSIGGE